MRFQIDGVRAGTTQPVRVELDGADLQSVMGQAAAMGIVQARVRPLDGAAAAAPPPVPGGAGAPAAPPPIPAPAYGGGATYGSNAYAGQAPPHLPPAGFPRPASSGPGIGKILLIIGVPLAALLVVAAIMVSIFIFWRSNPPGSAANSSLDPALYLPETKEGDPVVSISASMPKVLSLDASKNLRRQMNIDDIVKKLGLKITLDDVDELLVVGGGPSTLPPKLFFVFKLKKDQEISDMLSDPEKVGKPESIEGFDVYQSGLGAMSFLCKIGPKTYLNTMQTSHDDLTAYLTRVRAGKRIAFAGSVTRALDQTHGGDVVFCWDVGKDPAADAPRAAAGAIRVDASSITGEIVFLMKDENAAKASMADFQKNGKDEVEKYAPGTTVTQQGSIIKASGSIQSTVIEENFKKFMSGPLGR